MEKILIHKNQQIENLAHEISMIYVEEYFKKNYHADMIKNCRETGWMLNIYYQAKQRALHDLQYEFEIEEIE